MYQVQSRDSWSYSNGISEASCLPEVGCVHGYLSFLHLDTYFSTSPPAVGRILFQCRTPNAECWNKVVQCTKYEVQSMD